MKYLTKKLILKLLEAFEEENIKRIKKYAVEWDAEINKTVNKRYMYVEGATFTNFKLLDLLKDAEIPELENMATDTLKNTILEFLKKYAALYETDYGINVAYDAIHYFWRQISMEYLQEIKPYMDEFLGRLKSEI